MTNDTEPRALGAALSAPAFVTRGHGVAMHAASRHIERWAPEATAGRVSSMRSLGFVDRLVAPWMETAQRSASLRLFSQYAQTGASDRDVGAVSWVFPRPWYQDELDWMAAARQTSARASTAPDIAPTLLTTRGTYVPPAQATRSAISAPQVAMPAALYEHVAPSLSLAATQPAPIAGVGFGGDSLPRSEAYSPLISLAAVQAAELMSRAVAPLTMQRRDAATTGTTAMTPGLRSVLTSILERASMRTSEVPPTRLSMSAPDLETPPAPRASDLPGARAGEDRATEVADRYAEQRVRIAELQRIAQQARAEDIARTRIDDAARAAAAATAGGADHRGADAATARAAEVRAAEARAAAQAGSAEARAAAERAGASEAQRRAQAEAASEAARIEARIAQRLAERAASSVPGAPRDARTGRLHEQARAEAAEHVRTPLDVGGPEAAMAAAVPAAPVGASAAVIAAIAGLPPELSAILGPAVTWRPERAMQAIGELNDALRAAELLARSSASGAAFEVTRGPRLVMPAGLGGLVNAVDRAHAISDHPAMLSGQRSLAPLPAAGALVDQPAAAAARTASSAARVPALPWLSLAPRAQTIAPTTALGATATSAPAAISHVAWADRWLARFAGATPQSLDTITAAAAASPAARMQALANAAPDVVFVAPDFLRGDLGAERAARFAEQGRASTAVSGAPGQPSRAPDGGLPGMRLINPASPEPLRRFDDAAETPDDVFAAISAAASRGRGAPPRSAATIASADAAAAATVGAHGPERATLADLVAHSAPAAPGAGLSAQLASSPYASAMRHVLPLPSAASFDVRSLFGAGLGATYLAGLLGAGSHELEIGAQMLPAWAGWSEAPLNQQLAGDRVDRLVPAFDAAYVSPDAGSPDAVSAFDAGDARQAGDAARLAAAASASDASGPITTLRAALLSWDVTASDLGAMQLAPASFAAASSSSSSSSSSYREPAQSTSAARMMIEAMSLPMLGEATPDGSSSPASSWSAPGMVGDRAHSWSVAQQRSSEDLALDFVTPDLVLAARVYGLGPAAAAQAARLAIAGPGQLGAMASAVDRTFVEAMAIGREARSAETDRRQRVAATSEALGGAPGAPGASGAPGAAITTAFPTADGEIAAAIAPSARGPQQQPSSGAAFGVDRRSPRGAFLWPQATVAALGMTAAGSDGQLSMSVAALELLAAHVVAEVGTYAALSEADGARGEMAASGPGVGAGASGAAAGAASAQSGALAALPGVAGDARGVASGAEPAEADVLGAAAAYVPASRRARFDALYLALGQSSAGRSWSPAARAARALALASRGDDAATTARERAAVAWDVLPVVYANEEGVGDQASPGAGAAAAAMSSYVAPGARSSGAPGMARASRSAGRDAATSETDYVTVTSGLGGLAARAGEALGAYVAPAAPPSASTQRSSDSSSGSSGGAVLRAPSAAPEYVQTGRSGGRYGGNELEVPSWFEAAARRMLADRGDSTDGISLAELTLVNAAPPSHVAAATIAPSTPAAPSTSGAAGQAAATPEIDVETIAHDVYRQILAMMDAARARNGEPYL